MYVLVTYDVAGNDCGSASRLRRVAKLCCQFGQRVQYSVFECLLTPSQYVELKEHLLSVIDQTRDSLRFYNLGKNRNNRVEEFGAKRPYDPEGLLFI